MTNAISNTVYDKNYCFSSKLAFSGFSKTSKLELQTPKCLGFSLIELLVVISIISLLVAMLIPSLNKAKQLAKNIQCLSNVRNITSAAYLYSSDFGRMQYASGKGVFTPEGIGQGTKIESNEGLNPYAGDVNIFECPCDLGYDVVAENSSYWRSYGTSYYYNCFGVDRAYDGFDDQANSGLMQFGYYTTYPKAPNEGQLDQVLGSAATKILITEQFFAWANYAYTDVLKSWHSNDSMLTSVGFLDGHAGMVDMDITEEGRPAGNRFDAADKSYRW